MNTNSVLILDLKGNINSQKTDSRLRHETYAKKLSEVSSAKPLQLIVISQGRKFEKKVLDLFDVKLTQFSKFFFIQRNQCQKVFKTN